MSKTHYKKLANPDYMGAYSLDNGDNGYIEVNSTVLRVVQKEVVNPQGQRTHELVGYTDQPKPFILNRTAQKVMVRLSKSRYVEDWVNIPITFYVETGVRAFGDVVDALRIKQQVQAKKVDYTPFIKQVEACKTLEALKSLYTSFDAATKAATLAAKDKKKVQLTPEK